MRREVVALAELGCDNPIDFKQQGGGADGWLVVESLELLVFLFPLLELYPRWFQGSRFGCYRALARNHHHTLAKEGLTLGCLEIFHRGLTTVIRTYHLTLTFIDEVNLILSPRT